MNIIEYLPPYLQEVKQFQEIAQIEDEEFKNINKRAKAMCEESIISLATEEGLARYEKILNINSSQNVNLEDRRFMVKANYLNRGNFTLRWLKNKLYELCGDKFLIDIDYKLLKLNISLDYSFKNIVNSFAKELENVIPCCIKCSIIYTYNDTANICIAAGILKKEKIEMRQVN